MRPIPVLALLALLAACNTDKKPAASLTGTWQLLTGTIIEKNDTTVTDYTKDKKFIKVINDSHFCFMGHDLKQGKDSANAFFSAGGGTYTLKDSTYTEHLQYCSDRAWENNEFHFTVTIHNDTLIQQGKEKVAGTNIDRLNIEKYVRVKGE
ncbi:hypothetical protein [Longitalea luteola]|uniref:hypothetical protein n=1 Tax=Longitalea luteola TaxID=2812563 RepID=UPI001A973EE6|nr:hypothetical protein [Longitalea luteola]